MSLKRSKNNYSISSDMSEKVVIISAPSGAGKSTIVKAILETDMNLEFSISACSRPMRKGEIDGEHYYFSSVEEFKKKIEQDEFLEWEEVYKDHFYGTLKSELKRIWDKGKVLLIDADVYGGINIKNLFGEKALSLFIMPPNIETLKKRLLKRSTDKATDINIRVAKAAEELKLANKFDKIVVNDDLESAIADATIAIESFINDD